MIAKHINLNRLRAALDCLLLLAIILVALGYVHAGQANPEKLSYVLTTSAVSAQAQAQQNTAVMHLDRVAPSSVTSPSDNNILAAVIAAENAALTIPQYLTALPIITR